MCGPHHCLGRGPSAPESNFLCCLLQLRQNASVVAQGCADFSSDSTDRNHSFMPHPRWPSPSLRPGLSFRYTQRCRCVADRIYGQDSTEDRRQAGHLTSIEIPTNCPTIAMNACEFEWANNRTT